MCAVMCRMAGRLLSRVARSSCMLAARGQIRQDHAVTLPAALRDEYYPKVGMFLKYKVLELYCT